MSDDRLSNIFLLKNRLDSEKSNILSKYNWASQVEELFSCINELEIWKNLSLDIIINEKKMNVLLKGMDYLSYLN